jgi:hypothetical protein
MSTARIVFVIQTLPNFKSPLIKGVGRQSAEKSRKLQYQYPEPPLMAN